MVCTFCFNETQVINSRYQKRLNCVWRRRKCLSCKNVFSTIEQVDYEKSWVVQYSDNKSLPFQSDRLLLSLYKSLQHRSTALNDTIALTKTIMSTLQRVAQNGIITATAIATAAHNILKRFDKAAAVMYQAYHADAL